MSASQNEAGLAAGGKSPFNLRNLLLPLVAIMAAVGLGSFAGRPTKGRDPAPRDEHDEKAYRRELHSYFWGVGLALGLTLVPFALVYWSMMSPNSLAVIIGVFAFVQIVVHFRFLLHVDPPRQKRDDLYLILFSTLILVTMGAGTIWIMGDLAERMH